MSRYFRNPKLEDIITADLLNALYEKHIQKPLEEAHPLIREKLFEHMNSTTAHHLISRLNKALSEHKHDPKAHWSQVEALQEFLKSHSHPELRPLIQTELVGLIEEHKKIGHSLVVETLGKAYISETPPDHRELPDGFLWYNPELHHLYMYYNGEWLQVSSFSPYAIDEELFWVVMCIILCADIIFSSDNLEKTIQELAIYTPFINWNLLYSIVSENKQELEELLLASNPLEGVNISLTDKALYWLYSLVHGHCNSKTRIGFTPIRFYGYEEAV